jgi:hypothetical protein
MSFSFAPIISPLRFFSASAICASAAFLTSVFTAPSRIAAAFAFFAFSGILLFYPHHKDTKTLRRNQIS